MDWILHFVIIDNIFDLKLLVIVNKYYCINHCLISCFYAGCCAS